MTAYLSIFEGERYAIAILFSLIVISFVIFRSSFVLRAIVVSPGVWLAPIFYLIYMVLEQRISPEIVLAFFFELCVLAVYLKLFAALLRGVENRVDIHSEQYTRWLMNGVYMQLAIVVYFLAQGNFGLFAEGSRIEYISDSKFSLYLTYLGMLIGGVSTPIAAAIVSRNRCWNRVVLFYIASTMVVSILAGSKGAGILQLIILMSMIRLKDYSEYLRLMRLPIVLGFVFTGLTISYVGDFLRLDQEEMVSLMFARIFLVNDGRALAIDLANVFNSENYSLFQESFRAVASVLGNPPINMPLGQLLYSEAFGTQGLSGANTSSTALLIAYGGEVEKFLFTMALLIILAMLFWAVRMSTVYLLPRLALGLLLLVLLSQDFLAFQLCMNITIAGILMFFIFRILRCVLVDAGKSKQKSLDFK